MERKNKLIESFDSLVGESARRKIMENTANLTSDADSLETMQRLDWQYYVMECDYQNDHFFP